MIPRRWFDKKRCSWNEGLVTRVLRFQNIEMPVWEVGSTVENALYKLLEILMSCEMYQDSAVKLIPGLAHPWTPEQPKESFARVEGRGTMREELLGQRVLVSLLEPKAPLEML